MLNRRKFLRYSVLAAGGLSVSFVSTPIKITPLEKAIRRILTEDLNGLKVNPKDIEHFAWEVANKNVLGTSFVNTQLICLYQVYGVKYLLFSFHRRYTQLRADMTGTFLLSTDFFANKMDEQKDIRYAGTVYHTYKSACANPFSGLYYPV